MRATSEALAQWALILGVSRQPVETDAQLRDRVLTYLRPIGGESYKPVWFDEPVEAPRRREVVDRFAALDIDDVDGDA